MLNTVARIGKKLHFGKRFVSKNPFPGKKCKCELFLEYREALTYLLHGAESFLRS
jgi:hypothetical protein